MEGRGGGVGILMSWFELFESWALRQRKFGGRFGFTDRLCSTQDMRLCAWLGNGPGRQGGKGWKESRLESLDMIQRDDTAGEKPKLSREVGQLVLAASRIIESTTFFSFLDYMVHPSIRLLFRTLCD